MVCDQINTLCVVRRIVSHHIYLNDKDYTSHGHRNSDYWQIIPSKLQTAYVNMLPCKDIPPEHTSKGSAESRTECAIIDAQSHTVDGAPKRPVAYGGAIDAIDFLPRLYDARQEDRCANIGASELFRLAG